jgi:ATP-dependent helicase HrpA
LYAEDDYASRPEFTDPEILRSNLAGVILTMLNLRLGTMEAFPWVQAPEGRHVQEGWRVLDLLGIVDAAQQLTPLGRELARLPLDPRIARIAWAGKGQAIAPMVAVLAAALSVQDPHEMPAEAQDSARAKHKEWRHEKSDFLSLWQLWTRYQAARADMGQKKLRQWCKQHFVSYVRLEEWHNVAVQIGELLGLKDLSATFDEGFYPHLHQALLAGLCDQIGQKDSRPSDKKDKKPQGKRPPAAEYNGVRGKRFKIFPASTLIKSTPEWLVAANVTLTSQLFARTCASIEPAWLERAAPHLLKKVLHQPQWNPERGEVSATEQVSFLGMLIGKHRRHYGSGQPREARVLFIQHALVAGEWPKKPAFLQANFDLIDSIRDKEIKLRRPDLLADESQWFAFYDQRIPSDLCTCQGLVQWLKSQPKDLLLMQEKHLLRTGANTDIAAFFPDHILMGGIDLKLSYHHDPSAEADGVSFHLPLSALYALPEAGFEWLVPGLLPLKIEGLFKTLPVHLRRLASPMREYADALASSLSVREGVLIEALCQRFKAMTGVQFQPEDFQPDKLPPFLRPRLLVEDQGKLLAEGTSLSALQQKLAPQARQQLAQHPFNQKQVKAWSFGDLPAQVGTGFPALCAEGEVVHLQLFESQNAAETAHRNGVAALLLQQWGSKDVIKLIKSLGGVHLIANGWQADVLGQQLAEKAVSALVGYAPRQQAAFQQLEGRRGEFYKLAFDHAQEWATWLPLLQEIRHKLKTAPPEAAQDIQQQLTALFAAGYMQQIPTAQWPRVRVYLKAILLRLERWKPQRDADCQKQIRAFSMPSFHPAHWVLEEWRVLLFGQELKAVGGPSGEKIKALLVP